MAHLERAAAGGFCGGVLFFVDYWLRIPAVVWDRSLYPILHDWSLDLLRCLFDTLKTY